MSNKPKINQSLKKTVAERWDNLPKAIGNIGDSLESRLPGLSMLGGGNDVYTGLYGLSAFWPAQGMGLQTGIGVDQDPRTINTARMPGTYNYHKLAWSKIHICRHIYENDGYVGSIIDLMADFCVKGISFVHKSKALEKFYNNWAKQINLVGRFRRGVIDALVSGNLFWYRIYAQLTKDEISELKSAKATIRIANQGIVLEGENKTITINPQIEYDSEISLLFNEESIDIPKKIRDIAIAKLTAAIKSGDDISLEDNKIETKTNRIPWKYISLNPLQMYPEIDGSWSYLMTKEELQNLVDKLEIKVDMSAKVIKLELPNGIKGNLKRISGKDNKSGFYAEMRLDKDRLSVLQYSKFDWSRWATPTLWKAFPTIAFKDTLRSMEIKTARSAINTVTLWKLGDHKEGILPTSEHFERLADMLKAPSQTLNVLWSSAIEAQVIQPKMDQVFNPQRWEELRKEIIAQFGITQAVVTGEGGNFSSSYISVQGLLEKLNTIRQLFLEEWLYPELKLIMDATDSKEFPDIMFDNMSLKDEKAEKTLILNLLDRGFISDETAMEYLNRNVDVERRRIKDQQKFEDDNDIVRRGPFMVPEGQSEIVTKQLKSQEKMAGDSNELQRDQMKHDKQMDQQKMDADIEMKQQQMQLDHQVNMHMAKKGQHPDQLKAKNAPPPAKPKKQNGRPPGTTGPQQNKRTPKPKQTANLIEMSKFIKDADLIAKQAVMSIEGKPLYKSLSKNGKSKVLDLVCFTVAENLYSDSKAPDVEQFKQLLATDIDLTKLGHTEFMETLNQELMDYRTTKGRKPSKEEIYSMYYNTYEKLINKLNEES